jgi:cyclopropane fatty-acyl-phospholipid synthase-like methyltransferase
MISKKEKLKATKDFEVDETVESVRENFINSFKLPIVLWEEYLKFLNTQMEQWLSFQQDYIESVRQFYDKFPGRYGNLEETDSYFKYPQALQKSYVDSVRNIVDNFTKKNGDLFQENIKNASSLFDSYFNLFRVHT